jgi:hypothetical protein
MSLVPCVTSFSTFIPLSETDTEFYRNFLNYTSIKSQVFEFSAYHENHSAGAKGDFPRAEKVFPCGETHSPRAGKVFPHGETHSPRAEINSPRGERYFPHGEKVSADDLIAKQIDLLSK